MRTQSIFILAILILVTAFTLALHGSYAQEQTKITGTYHGYN